MVLARAAAAIGGPVLDARAPLVRDLAPRPALAAPPARSRTLAAGLLAVFLFVLPFASNVALRNALLVGCAALLVHASRGAARQALPPPRVLVPVLALAAWCLLSVAWSVTPAASARELWPELGAPLLAFLVFHAATRDAADLDRWAAALAAGLVGLATLAIGQEAFAGGWDPRRWHVDVGYYTTHGAMVLPLLGWLWLRQPGRGGRAALAVAAALTLLVFYWTDNRIVWPTLAAMAVAAALLGGRAQDAVKRRRLALAALAAVAASTAVFLFAQHERNVTLARMEPGANAHFATDPRLRIWPQAVARWREAPWVGHGFGRPAIALPAGAPHDDRQDPRFWHAHNVFLDVALELGVVGLALFAGVLAVLGREAWRAVDSPAPRRWAAIAALAALLAFLMKNFPDDFFLRHITLLCAALAGAFTGYLRAASDLRPTAPS
jgi:O-antigen ligase